MASPFSPLVLLLSVIPMIPKFLFLLSYVSSLMGFAMSFITNSFWANTSYFD